MEAKNFRIGNLVLFAPKGTRGNDITPRICAVKRIEEQTMIVNDMGFDLVLHYDSNELKRVLIGDHELALMGFTDGDYPSYYEYDGLFGEFCFEEDFLIYKVEFDQVIWKGKFLHDLQNLIFALKGEEFQLNDK